MEFALGTGQNGQLREVVNLQNLKITMKLWSNWYLGPEKLVSLGRWSTYEAVVQTSCHWTTIFSVRNTLFLQVSTENFDYWLHALGSCCEGEACLDDISVHDSVSLFIKKVTAATNHYQRGLAALKVCSGYISLLVPILPKLPCQCYSGELGNLSNLSSNKEIHVKPHWLCENTCDWINSGR